MFGDIGDTFSHGELDMGMIHAMAGAVADVAASRVCVAGEGWKFRRQVSINPYIVDFLCLDAKLVIEVDGGQHDENRAKDEVRTRFLEGFGLRVIRFWNNEVLGNLEGVLERILIELKQRWEKQDRS